MSIKEDFQFILSNYLAAKSSSDLRKKVRESFASAQTKLENLIVVKSHPNIKINFSIGIGGPANVPWLALLDKRETNTTRKGTYVVYLFSADMSGVYATFNQGVGASASQAPTKERLLEVQVIARTLRTKIPFLKS